MKDIRNTNIRFNLDNPLHQKAWAYLQSMDKKKFKSYSHVIILALVDFFDRYYRQQDDPYFETREREERFVQQIVDEVGKNIRLYMPQFMIRDNEKINNRPVAVQEPEEEETIDIDWSFIQKG